MNGSRRIDGNRFKSFCQEVYAHGLETLPFSNSFGIDACSLHRMRDAFRMRLDRITGQPAIEGIEFEFCVPIAVRPDRPVALGKSD